MKIQFILLVAVGMSYAAFAQHPRVAPKAKATPKTTAAKAAQPTAPEPTFSVDANGRTKAELIFSTPGTKDELFQRGRLWLHNEPNPDWSDLKAEDKAAAHIVVRGEARGTSPLFGKHQNNNGTFTYDQTLDFQDGKCRIILTNITYKKGPKKTDIQLPSGADIGESYPSNWPTTFPKTNTSIWQELQSGGKMYLTFTTNAFWRYMTQK